MPEEHAVASRRDAVVHAAAAATQTAAAVPHGGTSRVGPREPERSPQCGQASVSTMPRPVAEREQCRAFPEFRAYVSSVTSSNGVQRPEDAVKDRNVMEPPGASHERRLPQKRARAERGHSPRGVGHGAPSFLPRGNSATRQRDDHAMPLGTSPAPPPAALPSSALGRASAASRDVARDGLEPVRATSTPAATQPRHGHRAPGKRRRALRRHQHLCPGAQCARAPEREQHQAGWSASCLPRNRDPAAEEQHRRDRALERVEHRHSGRPTDRRSAR